MAAKPKHPSAYTSKQVSNRNRVEFLELLRGDPRLGRLPMSVRAACDQLGVSRMTVRKWRQADPDFAAAYEDAMDDGVDVLEDAAVKRAVEGVPEPVYQGGELVGHKQRYSDSLLELLLVGKRAGTYGKQAQQNTQVNVAIEAPSDRDVAKALSLLIEEERHRQRAG